MSETGGRTMEVDNALYKKAQIRTKVFVSYKIVLTTVTVFANDVKTNTQRTYVRTCEKRVAL